MMSFKSYIPSKELTWEVLNKFQGINLYWRPQTELWIPRRLWIFSMKGAIQSHQKIIQEPIR